MFGHIYLVTHSVYSYLNGHHFQTSFPSSDSMLFPASSVTGSASHVRRRNELHSAKSANDDSQVLLHVDISFTVIDIRGSRGRCKMRRRDSLLNVEALIPVLASGRSEIDRKKCISFLAR